MRIHGSLTLHRLRGGVSGSVVMGNESHVESCPLPSVERGQITV